jgi:hypothetical protein
MGTGDTPYRNARGPGSESTARLAKKFAKPSEKVRGGRARQADAERAGAGQAGGGAA